MPPLQSLWLQEGLHRQTGPGPWQPLESNLPLCLTIGTHSQPSSQESPRRKRHTKSPSMKREYSLRAHGSLGVMLVANLPNFQHTEQSPAGGLFGESMPLGGMCISRGARAHSEPPGDFTGVCSASAELGVGFQAHASCSCQCHFACRRGRGPRNGRRCIGVSFG